MEELVFLPLLLAGTDDATSSFCHYRRRRVDISIFWTTAQGSGHNEIHTFLWREFFFEGAASSSLAMATAAASKQASPTLAFTPAIQ